MNTIHEHYSLNSGATMVRTQLHFLFFLAMKLFHSLIIFLTTNPPIVQHIHESSPKKLVDVFRLPIQQQWSAVSPLTKIMVLSAHALGNL